jgi:hypothetical protein
VWKVHYAPGAVVKSGSCGPIPVAGLGEIGKGARSVVKILRRVTGMSGAKRQPLSMPVSSRWAIDGSVIREVQTSNSRVRNFIGRSIAVVILAGNL